MGMEFKKPLIIGDIDASVKSDISQIKQDIGDLSQLDTTDKDNLVDAINEAYNLLEPTQQRDYIDNSKAVPTGSVSTNNLILPEIKNYAHSTFDLSKFNVVGSPNITDDGVVSGFSNSSLITINKNIAGNIVEITQQVKFDSLSRENIVILCRDSSNAGVFSLLVDPTYYEVWGATIPNRPFVKSYNFEVQTSYIFKFALNYVLNTLNIKLYNNSGILLTDNTINLSATPNNISAIRLGKGSLEGQFLSGSIDLKQFSITVDGVEVFSGNKTGIDIIKPTNFIIHTTMYAFVYDTHTIYANSSTTPTELYNADGTLHAQSASEWQIITTTVDDVTTYDVQYNGNSATYTSRSNITQSSTNSPMVNPSLPWDANVKITADGIASGFTNSNYLTVSTATYNIDFTKPFKLHINGTYEDVTGYTNGVIFMPNVSGWALDLKINLTPTSANAVFHLAVGSSETILSNMTVTLNNNNFNLVLEWTGSQYKLSSYDATGIIIGNPATYSSSSAIYKAANITKIHIGSRYGSNYAAFVSGSIDLNAFKIYVDGNLVYQPCLKIPYTESKTGSKVVNAIYRDRVNDMADQFGYANYYTLDEDNGNFTLPQVELYGLIGQRTLRDSYRNGINYWELYSNRDLEQGGSCTSGVEVTFARPFADTNYVLSVPYSAKSATAFTPTQTGDWIAKGKGVL